MKKNIFILAVIIVIFASSCTAASRANISSYGQTHRITMYSGGEFTREWTSKGKVTSLKDSDGWQFMDSKTGKLVRVGGDVIIEVID